MALGLNTASWAAPLVMGLVMGLTSLAASAQAADKLTYHGDPGRSGWNAAEKVLTPVTVASPRFGELWRSPQLDGANGKPARLFATPLYLSDLAITAGPHQGRRLSAAFVVSTAGYAYAISTGGDVAPGTILWRRQLTDRPCADGALGNLGTPVIDRAAGRLYVTACSGDGWAWSVHALNLMTGDETPGGWPLAITAAAMNVPGLNHNGATRFIDGQVYLQRGALNLSPDGSRLYVAFGPDVQGWLVSVDTAAARIASAFSTTSRNDEEQGGMWGSAGASVDAEGRVHISTGANFNYTLAKRGIAGVFPDSAHNWGQSVLQFTDTREAGLALAGTYTPYNYCQTAAFDIDIGGSGASLIDLPPARSAAPRLLALGGGKQGNAYLLDRDHMPGDLVKRQACSSDPTTDRSLLAPEIQAPLKAQGPVNVFGPFSDDIGMANQAKSRSTLAWRRDAVGDTFLYLTGASKTGADFSTSVPPGLAKVKLEVAPGRAPFLRIDRMETTQTLQNPGSPVVSSDGVHNAIVWVMDPNAPRSMDLFQPDAPRAMLYAFDADSLKLLWNSGDTLFTSGKYNEPTVVDGLVLVGTDRLQAFGLRPSDPQTPRRAPPARIRPATKPVAEPIAKPRVKPANPLAAGRKVFETTCSACHGAAAGGAPAVAVIARLPRDRIVEALTTGKMSPMASHLNAGEIAAVADYLRGLNP